MHDIRNYLCTTLYVGKDDLYEMVSDSDSSSKGTDSDLETGYDERDQSSSEEISLQTASAPPTDANKQSGHSY